MNISVCPAKNVLKNLMRYKKEKNQNPNHAPSVAHPE
jgi:hypothetical protein